MVEFIKTLQILPEDAVNVVVDSTRGQRAAGGPGTVAMSVLGGVVGGVILTLVSMVGVALARRRRGHSS